METRCSIKAVPPSNDDDTTCAKVQIGDFVLIVTL